MNNTIDNTIDTVKHNKLIAVCEEFQNNDNNGSYQDIPQLTIDGDMTYRGAVEYLQGVINLWREDCINCFTGDIDTDNLTYYEHLEQQVKDVLKD